MAISWRCQQGLMHARSILVLIIEICKIPRATIALLLNHIGTFVDHLP